MRRLLTAVMIGSVIVAIPLTIVTVVMAGFLAIDTLNGHGNPWTPLMVASGPILVIMPVVAFLSVVIGLPFHFVIRRTRYASDLAYSLAGGIIGFAVLALPFLLDGTYEGAWIAPLGLVSGAATGHAWWRSGVSGRR
ncbi:hypothetical protein [Aureimonas ureilytica]|uniref:hypothetical protein n=1 Tax=Aureimonas ureilytica TaxID=401562 RepID=UPI000375D638|nr:hypothetical protein [Aureimonas ureilytica]